MKATMTVIELKNNKSQKLYPITLGINKTGHLTIAGLDITELVKKYGTPLYVIDELTFRHNANEYINSLKKYYDNFLILYAAKAFACKKIFKLANEMGLGLDVVSGGELYTAIKSSFNSSNIYFHGNNKSEEELHLAIRNNTGRIVCDNFYELELLQKTALSKNKVVEILIRLTPGIECNTHEYIKTGHLDSKFGFDLEYLDEVLKFIAKAGKNLLLKGFHSHIGSQIFEIEPFADSTEILLEQFKHVKEKYKVELTELNIGGGIGIAYTKEDNPISIDEWAKIITNTIKEKCKKLGLNLPKLICEPGRSLIAPSGITIYKAGSIKQVPNGRKFISVDGGMADNPRPITYQAKYTAVVGNKMDLKEAENVTIAGKYCETGDILIKDIELPEITHDDLIVVFGTGAYNYSMSSNYNSIPRPACILVNNEKSEIIIERETYEDLLAKQK
ncbi:MAG: diaminopimelate decarboxylase [Candidatus Melainabacteria bacterium RIFCSPLOWO2_02_FULL_35_15]|nr:MAG: diaminopimelate decarboxylase [Candidatus Melainabacteria bacterium RIFCSPLOWO2_12_FULL_35_11]OGI13951.1 MAG: diaminopimelate decarboxylase [Candidatus Melainabacteria bacterium RIFCSPLOWO2_02_FULL_35_15]